MKKTLPKVFVVFFMIAFCNTKVVAQDIHFSQIFETPLLRNPALAGLFSGDVRVQSVYRTQWNSVTVPYETVSMNTEFKIAMGKGDDFITLGGQAVYDKAGTVALTTTQVFPALNYHKSLGANNTYLSLGFMGGYVQRRYDMSKVTTNSQFNGWNHDPGLASGETATPSYSYLDGSAGISLNAQMGDNPDNNFFVGVGYHHFNRAKKISFYSNNELEMTPKVVGSAGVRMTISPFSYLTLEADHSNQGPYSETIGGMMISQRLDDADNPKYVFHAGLYLRWKDALIPVAKLECKPVAIAISYDANTSPLKAASRGRGGLEISISYQKYSSKDNSSRESVRCPRF